MLLLAAAVGAATGFGALGFRRLVDGVTKLAFGNVSTLRGAADLAWPLRLLLPVAGMVAAWGLARFFAREARGHGVPEVMEAVALRGGRIRPRVVIIKALASAMSIGTGGSVGREGPIVQIGSAIGATISRIFGLSERRMKLFVACGAAAGIAATFNAPIAGVLFSVEIILGTATIRTFSPIVISAVIATAVSRWFLGGQAAFAVPAYALRSPGELLDYVVLGLVAGILGVLFVRILYACEDLFERFPGPEILAPIVGGLIVGALGLFVPAVYGLGYEAIEREIHSGQMVLTVLLVTMGAKIAATSVTLAGGGSGGVFAPSLMLGAMLGGVVGIGANYANLWATASPGAYALVGMAAMVAATTHAPLTAILIIFELTGNYEIILPLMLASIIASVVSVLLERESIYTMKLARRGRHLDEPTQVATLRATPISDLVSTTMSTMPPDLPYQEVIDRVLADDLAYHYVVDEEGRLLGVIALGDIKHVLAEEDLHRVVCAHDLMRPNAPSVPAGATLGECLETLASVPDEELPVVDDEGVLRGVLHRNYVLALYTRELFDTQDLGVLFVTKEGRRERRDYVELPRGHAVGAVEVPRPFVKKTLAQLDLRRKRELLVIGVRRRIKGRTTCLAPDPHEPLQEGSVLVVEGPKDAISWLAGLARD